MDDRTSTTASSAGTDAAAFEQVDWAEHGSGRRRVSLERLVLVVGVLAVLALAAYHRSTGDLYLIWRWNAGYSDWLALLGIVFLFAYGVVPFARQPARLKQLLNRLYGRWGTILGLLLLAAIICIGSWALLRGFRPNFTYGTGSEYLDQYQPPVGTTVLDEYGTECYGPVSGEGENARCHGTWKFPLGTDRLGYEMTHLLVAGMRPVAYIALVTAGLIVPLATAVGLVAGYYGGLVDDLLMAYVDVQLSIPAILVYLVAFIFIFNSMTVFLIAFGLLSWGGIARIVRSETLQRREEGYVRSARAVGGSRLYVLREHLLPNVTNSVVPAAFQLIAVIVITEVALSFLGFSPMEWSWGETLSDGMQYRPPVDVWWTSVIPAGAVAITVVACKVAGDGLRDVLDPRGES